MQITIRYQCYSCLCHLPATKRFVIISSLRLHFTRIYHNYAEQNLIYLRVFLALALKMIHAIHQMEGNRISLRIAANATVISI